MVDKVGHECFGIGVRSSWLQDLCVQDVVDLRLSCSGHSGNVNCLAQTKIATNSRTETLMLHDRRSCERSLGAIRPQEHSMAHQDW